MKRVKKKQKIHSKTKTKNGLSSFFCGGCMKKNDYIVATCVDYTHDGQGIVKVDGFPVFVKNMLFNENAKIKIIKVLKNYAVGRMIELYQESVYRHEPTCPIFKQCGGCHLQHLSLEGQQVFKTKRVRDTMERIGHCNEMCIRDS